jgi:hypothetical protein
MVGQIARGVQCNFFQALLQLLQRGYRVFGFDRTATIEATMEAIVEFAPDAAATPEQVSAVFDLITLTPDSQARISLWSGGPRFMLIPAGEHMIIDLQGIPSTLSTLFFRIAHDATRRGTVFEDAFRDALKNRGFDVISGQLRPVAGDPRELDAGVQKGNRLILFECVSIERPLDYEIGNPETIKRRIERLDAKVRRL